MKLIKVLHEKGKRIENPLEILPTSNTNPIKLIKYGENYFLMVTSANELFVYGENSNNELGTGEKEIYNVPTEVKHNCGEIEFLETGKLFTIIVNKNNDFYFTGSLNEIFNYNYSTFTKVENLKVLPEETIKFIRAKGNYLFVVTNNSCIYGFGNNEFGQLGLGKTSGFEDQLVKLDCLKNIEIKDLQCGMYHSVILDTSGQIYVTGNGGWSQLGMNGVDFSKFTKNDKLPFKVKKISCGLFETFLLSEHNEIYGCGFNQYGILGNKEDGSEFTKIIVNGCSKFRTIPCSNNGYSCIVLKKRIYVTGMNMDNRFNLEESQVEQVFSYTELEHFKTEQTFVYPLLLTDNIIILTSNNKVNEGDEDISCDSIETLLEELNYNRCVDLAIRFKD